MRKIIYFLFLSVFIVQCTYSPKISKSIRINLGAVNGVLIEKNGANLVVYGDPDDKIKNAEMVLFTHFRRDVVWAGKNLIERGAIAVAPNDEKAYFTGGDSIWTNLALKRAHNYSCQTTKIGMSPLKISRFVKGGETLKWQGIDFKVLKTPGYTRGAVSYIANIDGQRFAFVGDLIYGDGKILDLYSFQDSIGKILGYHGYAARVEKLISSLRLIAEQKPDFIIPSRGPVITNPNIAIQKLINQIRLIYNNYLSVTAYRWYYPERVNTLSNQILGSSVRVNAMPFAPVIEENQLTWYKHISNTNLVFAEDSSAFLIDCGTERAFTELIKMKRTGRLKSLDGIFITHYHDDHTELINDVVKEFGCPVYATEELKDILETPSAFNMPCMTDKSIPNLNIMNSGQKMKWREFILTFYFFPGQTLFHDAVLFEKNNGEAIFFIGDSFTPSGIDDYCLLNRNLLHKKSGFLYCLDIIKKLPDNILLANQHVKPLFSYSPQQLEYLTTTLLERNVLLKDLFPFDDASYGVDEQWFSVYPYGQKSRRGENIELTVKIFNHSDLAKTFTVEPKIQKGLTVMPHKTLLIIEPLTVGEIVFKVRVSKESRPGVYLQLFNVKFDDWDLREWGEAIIEIIP